MEPLTIKIVLFYEEQWLGRLAVKIRENKSLTMEGHLHRYKLTIEGLETTENSIQMLGEFPFKISERFPVNCQYTKRHRRLVWYERHRYNLTAVSNR